MHRELAPIFAEAPARRLPATAGEALVMYAIRGPETTAERINLCSLINQEMEKIHAIMDDVIGRLEAEKAAGEGTEKNTPA